MNLQDRLHELAAEHAALAAAFPAGPSDEDLLQEAILHAMQAGARAFVWKLGWEVEFKGALQALYDLGVEHGRDQEAELAKYEAA